MPVFEQYSESSNANASNVFVTAHEVDITAGAAIGDVIKFARLSSGLIPLGMVAYTDGITGATSVDVGLYKRDDVDGSEAWDATAFGSAIDMSAAVNGDTILNAITNPDRFKSVEELAGADESVSEYVLAFTLNADPTADGKVIVHATWSNS